MINDAVLSIRGLRFRYKSSDNLEGFHLRIAEMEIHRGGLTAILGRSGCGKTTLLSFLGLLRQAPEGEITFALDWNDQQRRISAEELWESPVLAEEVRARFLGFALQNGELLPFLTLRENVELPLRLTKRGRVESKEMAAEVINGLFLPDELQGEDAVIDRKPASASRGQYQRGALARALAHRPQVVLADEPTGNLDAASARKVFETFRATAARGGCSIIVVTHDVGLAVDYCQEIWVLGKMGDLRAHYSRDVDLPGGWPTRRDLVQALGDD